MNLNDVTSIYSELEIIIKNGVKKIMNENPLYKGVSVAISNEQQFIKFKEEKDKQIIYMVIQYGQATVHYGQIVMPYTLTVLSEKNRAIIAQQLLYDYSVAYNMSYNNDKSIFQTCQTPNKGSSFQLFFEGFTSIFNTSGNFVISETANFYGLLYHPEDIKDVSNAEWIFREDLDFTIDGKEITNENAVWHINFASDAKEFVSIYLTPNKEMYFSNGIANEDIMVYSKGFGWKDEEYKRIWIIDGPDCKNKEFIHWLEMNENVPRFELVDFVTSSFKCTFSPDTQAFYFRKNFTHSINKYGNLSFSVVMYTTSDSPLVNDILRIITKKGDLNKDFKFTIRFLKKHSLTDCFKLIDVSADQEIGDMTMFVATFTN